MSIIRVRRPPKDAAGDRPTTPEDRLELLGAFTAPLKRITGEGINERGREGELESLFLYAAFDADVVHDDLVEVDGVPYEVDSATARWRHPMTGWTPGSEILLKRAIG